ncbi:MAG: carboxypeptidase regulatory-like domain-containing protein, partial [Pyrinomonadaceae bacterium]
AKLLKALLAFATAIDQGATGATINEESAVAAAREFASGDDAARVHRQLYAASRLLQKRVGFQAAYELAEAARNNADVGMTVAELTVVVQADEFRSIRARAIAAGGTPDIPEAPRNVLSNLMRGRIEDTSGWALFNQDKLDAAVEHLQRAVTILPEGTPAARAALWHLGVALERQDKKAEALSYYIKSYSLGELDLVRRAVIEQLYRKVNGSLDGLDEKIGPGLGPSANAQTTAPDKPVDTVQPTASPESTPAATPDDSAAQASPSALNPVTTPSGAPSPEAPVKTAPAAAPAEVPQATPTQSPEATPEPTRASPPEAPPVTSATPDATPIAIPESTPAPPATLALDTSPVEKMNKPAPTTVTITGQVKDSSGNPLANAVVVLISPQGTVLASTTNERGNYSFTVAASSAARSYRIIPSQDGLVFEPVDRVLPIMSDDAKELDFVGTPSRKP